MKNTVATFRKMKENHEKISMLTAYDYSTAKLVDQAGVNSILVGDSLGNVMLGYGDTIQKSIYFALGNLVELPTADISIGCTAVA